MPDPIGQRLLQTKNLHAPIWGDTAKKSQQFAAFAVLRSSNIILGIKANCSICWGDRGGDSEGAQFGSIIGSRALHNLLNSTLSPKAPFLGSLEFSTRLPLVDRLMGMIFQPQSSIPPGNPGTRYFRYSSCQVRRLLQRQPQFAIACPRGQFGTGFLSPLFGLFFVGCLTFRWL